MLFGSLSLWHSDCNFFPKRSDLMPPLQILPSSPSEQLQKPEPPHKNTSSKAQVETPFWPISPNAVDFSSTGCLSCIQGYSAKGLLFKGQRPGLGGIFYHYKEASFSVRHARHRWWIELFGSLGLHIQAEDCVPAAGSVLPTLNPQL